MGALASMTAGDVAGYVARKGALKGWTVKGHMTVRSAVLQ
jgi:hypothetical protein